MINYTSNFDTPFSEELLEDRIAANLIRLNKLTSEGILKLQSTFNKNVLFLNRHSKQNLKLTYRFKIYIMGQTLTPIGIFVTTEEIAKKLSPLGIKILIHGSGIWRIIAPMCEPLLNEWLSDVEFPLKKFITPHFNHRLNATPNDIDLEIWPQPLPGKISASLDELTDAFATLLAEKFTANCILESKLIHDIKCLQAFSMNLPTNSYLYQLFNKNKEISKNYIDLCKFYIEGFAFTHAVNISRPGANHRLRTLGSHLPYDFLFAQEARTTRMHLHSLFINTTTFLQKKINLKLKLESCINPKDPQATIQAIVDANLNLLTFDRSKPTDTSDYIRTLINFTFGSRCYQKGVIQELVTTVVKEAKLIQTPLAKLLADRFLHWHSTHKKKPCALIALAFNTCALLDFYEIPSSEIQQLWQLLLTQVVAYKSTIPLLRQIQTSYSSVLFEDFYSLVQISSHISQHHDSITTCMTTQTDGHPYVQIRFKTANETEAFVLFFPCNLLKAIDHFHKLPNVPSFFIEIYQRLVGHQKLKFKFDQSPRRQHANDFSRAFYSCLLSADHLFKSQHSALWFFGFQLTLAQLAQKSDPKSICHLWNHFLDLLQCKWACEEYIQFIIEEFHYTLQSNDVKLNIDIFNYLYGKIKTNEPKAGYKKLIHSLLELNTPLYAELALSFLARVTDNEPGSLYLEFTKTCLEPVFLRESLSALIEKINQDKLLSEALKFKFFLCIHSKQLSHADPFIEKMLFQYILKTIKILPDNVFYLEEKKKQMAQLAFKMLKLAFLRSEVSELDFHLSRLDLIRKKRAVFTSSDRISPVEEVLHQPDQKSAEGVIFLQVSENCRIEIPPLPALSQISIIHGLSEGPKNPEETAVFTSSDRISAKRETPDGRFYAGRKLTEEVNTAEETIVPQVAARLDADAYKSLFIQCMEDKQYLDAHNWLIKEQSLRKSLEAEFYQRFFNLIDLLIEAKQGQAVSILMASAEVSKNHQENLFKICQSLVIHQEFDVLLTLIKRKDFLYSLEIAKNHKFWETTLREWLKLVDQRGEKINNKQQNLLLKIIYTLIEDLKSNSNLWRLFILSISSYGSKKLAEKVFDKVLKQEDIKVKFSRNDHLACWIALLQRLSEMGSETLMDFSEWQTKVEKISGNIDSASLTTLVLKGAAKHMKKMSKKTSDSAIKKIRPTFITPTEDLFKSKDFNSHLCFYQSKIFSYATKLPFKQQGLSGLLFVLRAETSTDFGSKAVKLADRYVTLLSTCGDSLSIRLLRNCIVALQSTPNRNICDQYSIIKCLNLMHKNQIFKKEEEMLYVDFILKGLRKILHVPFDINLSDNKKKKKFIQQTTLELLNYPIFFKKSTKPGNERISSQLYHFFSWSINQPHLASHFSQKTIHCIKANISPIDLKIKRSTRNANRLVNGLLVQGITTCLALLLIYQFVNLYMGGGINKRVD